jgi:O-antigen/teichoic acid export membrane protein
MFKSDLAKRFVSLLSIDIFLKIVGFLLLPVYLKLMSTEEFGIFNYAFSLAMGLSFVMGTGQHIIVSRFYHNDEFSNQTIKETILFGVLCFISLYAFLGFYFEDYFISLLFKSDITRVLYYGVIYLALVQALNQILMTYLYQSENIKAVKVKSASDIIISHGTALSLLYFLAEMKSEIRIYAISLGFTLSITYFFFRKFKVKSFFFKTFSSSLFKRGLKNGIPVAIGSVSNIFINLGDRYNIEKLLDNHQLGIYSLGIALCNVLFVLFNSFQGAWWPVVFKEQNLMRSLSRIHKAYLFFFAVGVLFYIGVHPSIHIFTKFGVNADYLKTLNFLWVLVLSTFFQICSMLIGSLYEIFEKTYLSVIINIIFSITNIILNAYLINIYGLNGAAYATLIVSAGLLFFNYIVARYLLKFSKAASFYKSQE